jgi:hypothetical protein
LNRRYGLIAVGVAGALAVAAPLSAAPPGTDYNNPHSHTKDCGTGLSVTYAGPDSMWPPNHKYHKYQPFSVTGTDELGTPVSLTTTGTHNQYDGDTEDTEANGSGHTADDITVTDKDASVTTDDNDAQPAATESGDSGTVTTDWAARSERSGRLSDGRTYTVTGRVKDVTGARSCMETWTITVPHDQRPANRQ